MALLSEPKRKTKFGLDPRNTNWTNDDSKIGQRLMEKMGWEKGKGLGANETGMVENIKASYKSDTRGLGCSVKNADAWIAHQDDFNELLKNLNSEHGTGEEQKEKTKEQPTVDGQKRYYGRFARGSVPTLRSTEDLDCIFGKRKTHSEQASPSNESAVASVDESRHGLTTVTSTSNVQEYFAQKMSQMKARRAAQSKQDSLQQDLSADETEGKIQGANDSENDRVPSVYGAVGFSYESEPTGKDGNIIEVKGETSHGRGWYEQWPNGESASDENNKSEKKRNDLGESETSYNSSKLTRKHRKKKSRKCKDIENEIKESQTLVVHNSVENKKVQKQHTSSVIEQEGEVSSDSYSKTDRVDGKEKSKKRVKRKRKMYKKSIALEGEQIQESSSGDKGTKENKSKKSKCEKSELEEITGSPDLVDLGCAVNEDNITTKKTKKKKSKKQSKEEVDNEIANIDENMNAVDVKSNEKIQKEDPDRLEEKNDKKSCLNKSRNSEGKMKKKVQFCLSGDGDMESKSEKRKKKKRKIKREEAAVESKTFKLDADTKDVEGKTTKRKVRKNKVFDGENMSEQCDQETKSCIGDQMAGVKSEDNTPSDSQPGEDDHSNNARNRKKRKQKAKSALNKTMKICFTDSNISEIVGYGERIMGETKK